MTKFIPEKTDIVIVRYENNIYRMVDRFIQKGFHVKIYEKHPDMVQIAKYFVPKNKGNEASGFLQYIIEHYTCLPEHVVFLHDHEESWHHTGNINDLVEKHIGKKTSYLNLNSFEWNNETIEWIPSLLEWYDTYFYSELGSIKKYGDFMTGYKGCAQFIVHKSLILKRSLSFYKKLYHWLMNTTMDDYYSGRHLEYTWHLMWERVPKYNYIVQKICSVFLCNHKYNHLLHCIESHEKKKNTNFSDIFQP